MNTIKFAKLTTSAKLPTRKNLTDAGIDLYADLDDEYTMQLINFGDYVIIHTGITVEIPRGCFGWITNKSKNNFLIGGGIIDEGYQGELLVKAINPLKTAIKINHHDPIAQLLIIPCKTPEPVEVDLNEIHKVNSDRGSDGGIVRQLTFDESNHTIGDGTVFDPFQYKKFSKNEDYNDWRTKQGDNSEDTSNLMGG